MRVAVAALTAAAVLCGGAFAAVGRDAAGLPVAAPARVVAARLHVRPHFRPSDRLTWPDRGKVTGAFGEMRAGHRHEGIDIPLPEGTPIRAAAPGRVVLREVQQG